MIMETWYIIIWLAVGLISLITAIFPNISRTFKCKTILSVLLIGLWLAIINSNPYKHWKHFDDKNLNITCQLFPPIIMDENNFYYRYFAFLKNTYSEKIRITNFHMEFQSRVNIDNYGILLSDIPKNLLRMEIQETSILTVETEGFNGGQRIAISIDCSLKRREASLELHAATVNLSYKVFGKRHSKSIFVSPKGVWSFRVPKKAGVIFDLLEILDHRRLPEFFFTYHYSKISNQSGDRRLEVYCSDEKNRFLRIKYENPSGVIILESGRRIHKDFDPIRILVLANNEIRVHSWLGRFRLLEAAKHFRLGLDLVQKGDFEAGAFAFKKAIEIDPKDFQAWFNYGLALEKAKDYEGAIDALQNAIEVKGDYSKAHYELGNVLIGTGDEERATYHLKRAIEINPKYALAYFRLGCLQKSQGNHEEASRNLNNAIKYESDAERQDKIRECLNELWESKPIHERMETAIESEE